MRYNIFHFYPCIHADAHIYCLRRKQNFAIIFIKRRNIAQMKLKRKKAKCWMQGVIHWFAQTLSHAIHFQYQHHKINYFLKWLSFKHFQFDRIQSLTCLNIQLASVQRDGKRFFILMFYPRFKNFNRIAKRENAQTHTIEL